MPVAVFTLYACASFGSEGSNDLPARLNLGASLIVGPRWCGAPETVIARPFRCIRLVLSVEQTFRIGVGECRLEETCVPSAVWRRAICRF